jgi:hypothetical protein
VWQKAVTRLNKLKCPRRFSAQFAVRAATLKHIATFTAAWISHGPKNGIAPRRTTFNRADIAASTSNMVACEMGGD